MNSTHFELRYRNPSPPIFAEALTAMTRLCGQILRFCLKTGHDCFLTFFPISLFALLESLKPVEESWVPTAILVITLKNTLKWNLMSDIV